MPSNPTYEELEQKIQSLESKLDKLSPKNTIDRSKYNETSSQIRLWLIKLLDHIPSAVYIGDHKYQIEYANPTMRKQFGEPGDLKCHEYVHNLRNPCPWCYNRKAMVGERKIPNWHCQKNGRTYDLFIIPLKSIDNSISQLKIFNDITDQKKAISNFQESEKRFQILFEQAPIGIDLVTRDGNSMFANHALSNFLGYTEQELCSHTFTEWTHPEDVTSSLELVNKLREGKADRMSMEKRYIRKSGETVWGRTSVAAVRNETGDLNYFLAMVEDITDQKGAEKRLQESEQRYRSLFMNSPDAVFLNLDDKVALVNHACLKVFRANTEQELIGKSVYDLFHPDFHSVIRERVDQMRNLPEAAPVVEEKIICLDGQEVDVEVLAAPFEMEEVKAIHVILRDITARKRAEARLMESEKRLRLFIRHSPVALAMLDREMRYIAVSRRWVTDYKLENIEIIGRSYYEIFPEIPDHWKAAHQSGLNGEVIRVHEDRFERQDGTVQWQRWEVHPWRKVDNSVAGIVIFTEDITHSKLSEYERDKLRDQLTQAHKMESIGRLAGGISHDLNNLLSPIIGYAELLMEECEPGKTASGFLNQILQAGYRARDLVRQLLAFSRRQTLSVRPMDINKAIIDFEKLLRRTIPEDIEIKLVLSPHISPVLADIGQVEQVIMNLTVNAADAMPGGGRLTIETDITDIDETFSTHQPDLVPGRYVAISVSDTGIGMDQQTMESIFEPFFSTKGEHGTGLGLSTVYGIVKQHNGHIWVYSEPEKGTSFKILLPETEKIDIREIEKKELLTDLGGPETILIVEDNEQVRNLVQTVLTRHGYKVLVPESSQSALAVLSGHSRQIHLMLTDVVMPEMNGRELFALAAKLNPDLKVLFMSGYTDDVIAHRGVLDEGVNFIQKPFTLRALLTRIREVLERKI